MRQVDNTRLDKRVRPDAARERDFAGFHNFEATFAFEYNFSPISHVTVDRTGRICWLNLAAARLLKGEKSQFDRLPFIAFVEKSYCRKWFDHLETCVRLQRNVTTEVVLADYTRAAARVQLRSVPGFHPLTGEMVCRTVIIDLPAVQRQAELLDFIPDAILVHVDGKIVSANFGAARLLRAKDPARLLNLDILSIVHPRSHALVRDRLERVRQGESELPAIEERFLCRDGTSVLVNVITRSTTFQDRPAVLVLARDISKRHEMEKQLHQAEDLAAQILANNSIATAIISLKASRFLDVNEFFCSLAGFPRLEIIGRRLAEVGWRLMNSDQSDVLGDLERNHSVQNLEARLRRPDGGLLDVIASIKTLSYAGERCALLMLQDLTDLQRLRQDIVDISEEEQRRFGRDLHDSHCQELTAISFFAESIAAALETKDSENAAQLHNLANMISKSADSVHLLAAGLGLQELEEVGFDTALQGIADRLSLRFGVTCQARVDPGCRFLDASRAIHLCRIAQEAASNAARHGRATTIDIGLSARDNIGKLEIKDNGEGFSVEQSGTGLGLRTMKYRAAVIHGTLSISSRPESGTTITCSFPLPAAE